MVELDRIDSKQSFFLISMLIIQTEWPTSTTPTGLQHNYFQWICYILIHQWSKEASKKDIVTYQDRMAKLRATRERWCISWRLTNWPTAECPSTTNPRLLIPYYSLLCLNRHNLRTVRSNNGCCTTKYLLENPTSDTGFFKKTRNCTLFLPGKNLKRKDTLHFL